MTDPTPGASADDTPDLDELVATVGRVMTMADPVPASVVDAAKAAFIWRTIDAELAELTSDSLLATAAVRSDTGPRLLTFEAADLEVEVEVADLGSARRLIGQLVPTTAARIVVRWAGGSHEVHADDIGRFVTSDVPAGAISLVITRPDLPTVVTAWVSI